MKRYLLTILFAFVFIQHLQGMEFPNNEENMKFPKNIEEATNRSLSTFKDYIKEKVEKMVETRIQESPDLHNFPSTEDIQNSIVEEYIHARNKRTEREKEFLLRKVNKKIKKIKEFYQDSPMLFKLNEALFSKDYSQISKLIQEGADINQKTDGCPILMRLMGQNEKDIPFLEFLIKKCGANVNCQRKRDGITPLYFACLFEMREVAELLLRCGADITTPFSNDNVTVLDYLHRYSNPLRECLIKNAHEKFMHAVKNNEIKTLKALQKYLNINMQDQSGNTPLHYAIKNGNKVIIVWLLAQGAQQSMCIFNKQGELPMHLAVGTPMLPFLLKMAHDQGMPGYGTSLAQ